MTEQTQTLVVLNVTLFLQLAGLIFAVQHDSCIKREQRRILMMAILVVISLTLQGEFEPSLYPWLFSSDRTMDLVSTLLSTYGYIMRPVILVLFFRIQSQDRRPWILVGANTLIHLVNFFYPIVFSFHHGSFYRGPLGYTCHVVSFLLLAWGVAAAYWRTRNDASALPGMPLMVSLMIILATVVDSWFMTEYRISCLQVVIVGSCTIYYIWLHLLFVRDHVRDIEAEQRIQIMMSQIQPHFLYNTLSTIQGLCVTDPEMAYETLEKFGAFLRQNLDSLDQPSLIPLEQEMEHVKTYADIEMIRFPNIHVLYEVQDVDFELPALTIQPLVENAIRHGVRGRKKGLVTVVTFLEGNDHFVVIRDNGVGFDPAQPQDGSRSHIGINNVRERVEQMCGGSMTVESERGKGTVVTIRIPAGRKAK